MKIKNVIELLSDNILKSNVTNENLDLKNVKDNASVVEKNDIFIALKGEAFDGHNFILEATKNNAGLIIVENTSKLINLKDSINFLQVKNTKKALAVLLHKFLEVSSNDFKLFGVTGTNGKSTIATLLHHILRENKKKSSLISTVEVKINDEFIEESYNTTLSIPKNANLLKLSKERNVEFINMEVSSHALTQKRIENLSYDLLAFSNITRDHLDYHKDFEDYKNTKLSLLKFLKSKGKVIVNLDNFDINDFDIPKNQIITYGFDENSDYIVKDVVKSVFQMNFKLITPEKEEITLYSSITGDFNALNITAAVAAARFYGIDYEEIKKAIISFNGVPGRFELVNNSKALGFFVVVDFAHTPDALEKVLKNAREMVKGRVIIVFGAGGNADIGKRKIMGEIASNYANIIVLTNDDPKDDDEDKIIENIKEGVDKEDNFIIIKDRENAINAAINFASREDIVIISGRGHEKFQLFANGKKVKFNDYEVAEKIIDNLRKNLKK